MKNKAKPTIIDGKMVDLNSIPEEELREMEEKLKARREELRKKLNEMLDER
jgi:hypothetical protein